MFTKKPVEDASFSDPGTHAPSRAANRSERARRGNGAASIIGQDLVVNGNLHSEGEVEIEGEVQGDVEARRIVVGERAQVVGALIADEVVVRGGGRLLAARPTDSGSLERRDLPSNSAPCSISSDLWKMSPSTRLVA